ncbi:histidine phosphatase family protein [Maritimibacter sp. DP1N21-5]|uniref:SixA phosphatase family protein n=1 Tax=Maritimibacter sp. DP1N21-5 TaxID=2836867 RepID=UPI001C452D22|nr:histidine phosphatase family protein [Maritimibacter sp. DP1N21-5]MBV7408150.1 histidine phosphatase family protein [Maritimibacter sp. DP1N21-5]
MTLRLILTRHAKSSWDDPLITDRERPLNRRGRASAAALGRWLAGSGMRPDQALVSAAERTRETWEIVKREAGFNVKADHSPALYLSEPDTMLSILKGATGQVVMLIAHNPGISFFARSILETPRLDSLYDRYPTGATAVIDFDADSWDAIGWRSGTLAAFEVPRHLIEEEAKAATEAALTASGAETDTPVSV